MEVDYGVVFDAAPVPLLLLTPDLVIVDVNQACLQATATTLEALVGRHMFDVFPVDPDGPHAETLQALTASLVRARESKQANSMSVQRYDIRRSDGTYAERYWSPRNVPLLDQHGNVMLLLHRTDDVTDHLHSRQAALELEAAREAREGQPATQAEPDLFVYAKELHELNRELRLARDELAVRALHDPLTGLLVRPVLLEQLAHALARLERSPGDVAVLFVDLDGLKQVNDHHGHAAGDALIRCFAERLQLGVRPSDTVARIGGDEFVVLLDEVDPGAGLVAAEVVAQRLLASLDASCPVTPGAFVRPSASIGIATVSSAGSTAEDGTAVRADVVISADELLSRADEAMYQAKRDGAGRYRVFDETAHRLASARQRLQVDLRDALPEQRLRLHYQPIIDLRDGALFAVEALLRWEHPDGHLRTASQFIDIAEQAGLLPQVGRWVIAEACRQLARWDAALGAGAPQQLFLNLSPGELSQTELHQHLADSAHEAGIRPQRLVLEVTETGMLDTSRSAATLDAVQRLGCQLAIDDFGTGYSSLSRLVHLPASVLKVDRSFLRDLHRDQASVAVIAAVLTLAHNLRKTVIAEGVEDAASLAVLQDLGCSYGQGYHLARPQAPDELAARLALPSPFTPDGYTWPS